MNPRMLISLAAATMSLVFAAGCSSEAKKKSQAEAAQAESEFRNQNYASLSFEPGETRLSALDKRDLQLLAEKVRQSRQEIDDIKILTWADKDYHQGEDAPNPEVILARQRAESIKNYLDEVRLGNVDIDYYNMAQSPGPLGKYFKTKEEKVKKTFRANKDETMLKNRASKGLVIIEYEEQI